MFDELDGTSVSYSYLDKKNKSGLGNNVRLFFLYHKVKIGYINELDKKIQLPFSGEDLPTLQSSFELKLARSPKTNKHSQSPTLKANKR